ncbi:MAG TPA: metallophosphoesterase family protein [Ardenticatenaceae bacterium]|nr:metallophosphoesterase family protein [Ardenticatenaceae bacterium]
MRYLIISDIHANLVALETVLADAELSTIDEIWCLGDVVGYGPNPNECVARVRELATERCLVGNHDYAALDRIDISDFNPEARRAVMWTREQLTPESAAFLEKLPGRMDSVAEHFTLAHASPRHPIWEYILSPAVAAENFPAFPTQFCLVGHTHQPVIFSQDAQSGLVEMLQPVFDTPIAIAEANGVRLIINPGSVGQPRDGDPRASYAIYDDEMGALMYRRVPYNIAETQARMAAHKLPERLIARLDYGW